VHGRSRGMGNVDHGFLEAVAVKDLAAVASDQRVWLLGRQLFAFRPHRIFALGPIPLIPPFLKVGLGPLRQEDPPSRLEAGPGLVEGRGRGGALAGVTARIEPARPAPRGLIARDANPLCRAVAMAMRSKKPAPANGLRPRDRRGGAVQSRADSRSLSQKATVRS
jgi:hypothetical protein